MSRDFVNGGKFSGSLLRQKERRADGQFGGVLEEQPRKPPFKNYLPFIPELYACQELFFPAGDNCTKVVLIPMTFSGY